MSDIARNLTENQAIVIEAELIATLGTEKNGGILKNSVLPKVRQVTKTELNIPEGILEKSLFGLEFLKDSIYEVINANSTGVKNAELAKSLGLQSSNQGRQSDYLTYSVLGILMKEGKIFKNENGKYTAK